MDKLECVPEVLYDKNILLRVKNVILRDKVTELKTKLTGIQKNFNNFLKPPAFNITNFHQ